MACRFIISRDHHVELAAFGPSLTHLRLRVRQRLWAFNYDADLELFSYTNSSPEPYFFFESFFDSRLDSFDSFSAFLDSPGRYSSCSAAANAFSRPTMSSPGRRMSSASASLRSCSSVSLAALIYNPML